MCSMQHNLWIKNEKPLKNMKFTKIKNSYMSKRLDPETKKLTDRVPISIRIRNADCFPDAGVLWSW